MLIFIDTEASGPCPTMGDLISFGAVASPTNTFYSEIIIPRYDRYLANAYSSIGMTRVEHWEKATVTYYEAFSNFHEWLDQFDNPRMISDNPAFDSQWINFGFHTTIGENPLGHSARRIGDFYAGLLKKPNNHSGWKKHRKTKHTHHPVDDAMGNYEAWNYLLKKAASS